jgi:CheY-like chemotaxis protein
VEGSWWNHLALRMAVILVVEDEEQVRVLAKSYLEEQGHQLFPQEVPMARLRS